MTDKPELPDESNKDLSQRDMALSEIEKRYLGEDGYDEDGHLSHSQPGDSLRELIHEIRQTRTAIRLAEATFVSKTDLEERLKVAGENVTRLRHQAQRRLWVAVGVIAGALVLLGIGGGAAAWVFHHEQLQAAYDRCIQSNQFRQGDHDLWNEVITLSSHNKTPGQDQVATQFKAFLDQHDKLYVCKKP